MNDGPETLSRIRPVSRETLGRLQAFVALLEKWQRSHNLVAPSTLPVLWSRHVADSLQLLEHAPATGGWVDLGSGGGLPGVVVAIAGNRPVTLVESIGKKAAFLREAGRVTGAALDVRHGRIEDVLPTIHRESVAVISARALANLKHLCDFTAPFVRAGAIGLFPKGQDVESELTEATRYWSICLDKRPSLTDPDATILIVKGLDSVA
jgi:16S rRNA (guanine527-N7)-methyltransferase